MTSNARPPGGKSPNVITVTDKPDKPPTLKHVGGSQSDEWNNVLIGQVAECLWLKNSSSELRNRQVGAAIAALISFKPADELESMLAAQLISCHNAAMECYRRAMIGEQSFAGRSENLSQAKGTEARGNKKSPSSTLMSIGVGKPLSVASPRRGVAVPQNQRNKPMQKETPNPQPTPSRWAIHRCPPCKARTRRGTPCQSPAMANGRCRMHGGASTGAPKGNKNAFRHGR